MFRKTASAIIINKEGKVLLCKRSGHMIKDSSHIWQSIQGGIETEIPEEAILREIKEEVGLTKVKIIKKMKETTKYILPKKCIDDFPPEVKKKFEGLIGQEITWFLVKFTGDDSEIDFTTHPEEIEFDDYKWVNAEDVLDYIVDFKKDCYRKALKEFLNV